MCYVRLLHNLVKYWNIHVVR